MKHTTGAEGATFQLVYIIIIGNSKENIASIRLSSEVAKFGAL